MAIKKNKMSHEGYEKLEKKLEHLITVKRAEVAQKLKDARAFGDLSENAEYDEAKNEQGILEATIAEIEATLANAEVVAEADISIDEIGVGSTVKVRDIEFDEIEILKIVGSNESNPDENKISDEAPIGQALLKKKVGDVVEVETPDGIIEFEVLEISK